METLDLPGTIGDFLCIECTVTDTKGTVVEVDCENESFVGEIFELPTNGVPTEEHTTREVVLTGVEDYSDEEYAMYGEVVEMDSWGMDYDVYAIRLLEDGGHEDLGEITEIRIRET